MNLISSFRSIFSRRSPTPESAPSQECPPRDADWLVPSTLVDGVPFDVGFLIQRQLVIIAKQRIRVGERFPKLKGDAIAQPAIPHLLGTEHDYFRIALSANIVGFEQEMLRYYRSVLAMCTERGLNPKTDRDCRCCFAISPEVRISDRNIAASFTSSDVAGIREFFDLLAAPKEGSLIYLADQTGETEFYAQDKFLHIYESSVKRVEFNVRFLREPFENRMRAARQRMESLLARFRGELGDDFWADPLV